MKPVVFASLSLLLAVAALPTSVVAGDVCISSGGGGEVNCGEPPPPPVYTPPADPFAGVTSFVAGADAIDGSISIDGGPTFDQVNGLASGKTGSSYYMVLSDATQGIVLVPEDLPDGSVNISGIITLPTGAASPPTGVVVADLDGDGQDDIIAVNGADGSLSVFFGQSDGSFAPAVLVPLASTPSEFVLADIDGDGHPDLLIPDTAAGTLDAYINDGHGGFAVPIPLAAGDVPVSIGAADLDGDGDVDVVVGDGGDDSVSVLLNDGHGNFSLSDYSTSGVHPDHLVLVGMSNIFSASSSAYVSIGVWNSDQSLSATLAGNGDGSFQPAQVTTACAVTDPCFTATAGSQPTPTSGSKHKTPQSVPSAAAASGGGDIGLLSLALLGIVGLCRRFAR